MNKSKYANPEEREKALDFKIPEEAVFDRMEKQFGDCDRMLKELKIQILEKEKRDKEKIPEIKEQVSFLFILDKRRTICRRIRKSKKS
jgi:hypothetical protein